MTVRQLGGHVAGLLIFRDDNAVAWFFDGDRLMVIDDDTPDGGYSCDTLEDAVQMLIQHGYITPPSDGKAAFCNECGDTSAFVVATGRICGSCGQRLTPASTVTAAPVEPAARNVDDGAAAAYPNR